jgi:2-polyprenyl-3-methyl-5-hydroxy-6-metoxy-1,4-benzoquinol methylase
MKPTTKEYVYQGNAPSHAHSYLLPTLQSMLPNRPNIGGGRVRILDLGCGNGSLSHTIAKQGYEVVGVEESASGVAIARQSFPDCHFIQASIYNLPDEELRNSFDVVISVEVIEHLFYPRELIRAATKCLKPDGYLIITTPYHSYFKNIALAASGQMDKHFTALWDGGHIKFFSVNTLTQLLKTEGYTEINFRFAGRIPFLWKSMLCSCSPLQS